MDSELIEGIRGKVAAREIEYSRHAAIKTNERDVSEQEIIEAIERGTVIEDYPDDKYGPACLILGFTGAGRPLHVLCSYPSRPLVKIITLYEPAETEWINFRQRRTAR